MLNNVCSNKGPHDTCINDLGGRVLAEYKGRGQNRGLPAEGAPDGRQGLGAVQRACFMEEW